MSRAASGTATGMRRFVAALALCALAVGVSACASTEQESAKIARESQVAANQAAAPHASKKPHAQHGKHAAPKGTSG